MSVQMVKSHLSAIESDVTLQSEAHPRLKLNPHNKLRHFSRSAFKKQFLAVVTSVAITALAIFAIAFATLYAPLTLPTVLFAVTVFIPPTVRQVYYNFADQASVLKEKASRRRAKIEYDKSLEKHKELKLKELYKTLTGQAPTTALMGRLRKINRSNPMHALLPIFAKIDRIKITIKQEIESQTATHLRLTANYEALGKMDGKSAAAGEAKRQNENLHINCNILSLSARRITAKKVELAFWIHVLQNPFDKTLHCKDEVYSFIDQPDYAGFAQPEAHKLVAKIHTTATGISRETLDSPQLHTMFRPASQTGSSR